MDQTKKQEKNYLENLRKQMEKMQDKKSVCPSCGHCPNCGRGGWTPVYPVMPTPVYPTTPWYGQTITYC